MLRIIYAGFFILFNKQIHSILCSPPSGCRKALDRIEWNFLWSVLKHFGFGSFFLRVVKTIYFDCSARDLTGLYISSSFYLGRCTHQGCPSSPLLSHLSLEPLAQAIRQGSLITPKRCMNTSHKI